MTQVLGITTPDYAVLVTDTRLRSPAYVDDEVEKLCGLDRVWLAASGWSPGAPWLGYRVLNGEPIANRPSLEAALACSRSLAKVLRRTASADVLFIQPEDVSFALYAVDLKTLEVEGAPGTAFNGALPVTDGDEELERRVDAYVVDRGRELMERAPANSAAAVRALAGVCAETYMMCGPGGSISECVSFGILRRAGGVVVQEKIGRIPARVAAAASEAELARWCAPHLAATTPANGRRKPLLYVRGRELAEDVFLDAAKRVRFGTVDAPASITKTVRFPAAELVPLNDSQQWSFQNGVLRPGAAATTLDAFGALVLPKGATITTIRARMYRQDTGADNASCALVRLNDDGTNTGLGTVNHGASSGWRTDEVTLGTPQLVGDEAYTVSVQLRGAAAALDARFLWAEVVYTVPDLAVTL